MTRWGGVGTQQPLVRFEHATSPSPYHTATSTLLFSQWCLKHIFMLQFVDNNKWLITWNKKAQLSLTNPHDVKAWKSCSNSTCLQRCRWQYWPIFMRLAAVASEICEIQRNSLKIQTYWVQGHPRSSILVSIESPYVTSLIVTLAVSATVFKIFTVKYRKLLILLSPPVFNAP